jgi:hypothetical protein
MLTTFGAMWMLRSTAVTKENDVTSILLIPVIARLMPILRFHHDLLHDANQHGRGHVLADLVKLSFHQ